MSLKKTLTPRELTILHEFAAGRSYDATAIALGVSVGCIQRSAYIIYRKLGVSRERENPCVVASILYRREFPDTPLWYETTKTPETNTEKDHKKPNAA